MLTSHVHLPLFFPAIFFRLAPIPSPTLAQGQEVARDENAQTSDGGGGKRRKQQAGAVPGAGGGILNSPYAIAVGGAAVIGLTTWVLLKNDEPASPSKP